MTLLHQFGELLRRLLLEVPMPVVRAVFVAVPALLLVWVLCQRPETTHPEDRPRRAAENLKLWAGLALVLQILIYLLV